MFFMVSGWDPSQILGGKTGKPWESCELNDCEKLLQVVSLLWKRKLWHIMTYWMGKSRNMITIKDLWQSPSGTRTSSRKDLFRVPVVLFEGQHPRHWCLRIQAWSQGHKRTIKPLFNKALQKSLEIRDTNFKRNNETKSNKSKQRNNQLINKQYAHLSLSLARSLSLSRSLSIAVSESSAVLVVIDSTMAKWLSPISRSLQWPDKVHKSSVWQVLRKPATTLGLGRHFSYERKESNRKRYMAYGTWRLTSIVYNWNIMGI